MSNRLPILLVAVACLSSVPLATVGPGLGESSSRPACRIDNGILVADFSKLVADPISSVVFVVHRKAEAVLSVIVPLRVNPPVFMVRVRPVNSLADSAKLSVSCSLVPIFGSDSTAKDAACKSFLPIDSGVQLTVREIELSKDGALRPSHH
jgi:hypothetical protein